MSVLREIHRHALMMSGEQSRAFEDGRVAHCISTIARNYLVGVYVHGIMPLVVILTHCIFRIVYQ